MLKLLSEYFSSIVILIILIVIVALIIRKLLSDKKQGKSSCGAGCANCAMKGSCHGGQKN